VGVAIVLLFICSGGYICCNRADWPIKLIVNIESERKKYCYIPRSDFHISVDGLVYLLVEVQTKMNVTDIGYFFRLHVRPDLGSACLMIIRSLSWHCTSRTLVG